MSFLPWSTRFLQNVIHAYTVKGFIRRVLSVTLLPFLHEKETNVAFDKQIPPYKYMRKIM